MNISTISPAKFDTGKSVTLSGTGFGSSQGTVTIGGVSQAVTSWSDTSITFTSVRGAQSMGACRVDVVKGGGFATESGFSASGTFADGGEITITKTGGGFGTKPNGAKPWLYLPHGTGLDPDINYSRGSATHLRHNAYIAHTTSAYPENGSGAVQSPTVPGGAGVAGWTLSDATQVYVFGHRKFSYDILNDAVATNHKWMRLWTNIDSSTPPNSNVIAAFSDTTIVDCRIVVEYVSVGAGGDNSVYWSTDGNNAAAGVGTNWHTFEQEFARSSGPGIADGVMVSWINGKRANVASALTTYDGTYTANTYKNIFFSQLSNNVESSGGYIYYGPVLIDDSRCRVVVSAESTWNTSATTGYIRDFCLPTAWADDSITLTIRQGIHNSLAGKYLYVVKSDGSAVKIGGFA
jgi:hypothetical protein